MVGLVLAGHGNFPEGVKHSVEMISGPIKQSVVVCLNPGDDPEAYGATLKKAVEEVDTGDGVLIMTDIRGGTPFNQSLMLCREKKIQIVVGTNIPLVLVVNLGRTEETTLNELSDLVLKSAAESIDVVKYSS